ncbi:hypothetical protein INS49_013075 [Diaporthe citri]|uniref:uncharacterized protein n=1 Tax=Diaporthe citri TaxID=83186 RepID=UPI001C827DE9|nr:uncharacterized protein INS49_013075 [Diaporthe citri]KAG6359554.1 hypothetical protein INS49_013075 [Diaporthe citri]
MELPSLIHCSKVLTYSPGCMTSISAVAVPVFLDTTPEPALLFQQWARTYHYGHQALPTLSVATCGLYAYLTMKRRAAQQPWVAYAAAAIVTVIMVPFTWIVMVPTNNLLFRLTAESQVQPLNFKYGGGITKKVQRAILAVVWNADGSTKMEIGTEHY